MDLAARGETPAAFGRRCIPAGCVAPRSNTPGILARRALPAGRIAALGATLDFHHGLPGDNVCNEMIDRGAAAPGVKDRGVGAPGVKDRGVGAPGVKEEATAIVLAGGRSSRMGRPKALLLFDDTPLIVHIVAALQRLFAEVVVVAAPGQILPSMPVKLVHDDVAYQGPVGGICYGLAAASREVSFVTSCDSAFLNAGLISHLVSEISTYDVVVPYWEGRLQPLHAVYRRSVLALLEAQLARGELRPVYLFDRVRTRRIDEDEIRRFDAEGESFFNMNTPDDYAEALERWNNARRRGSDARTDFVHCTVELFGVARLVAQTREVSLALPSGATFEQVFEALAARLPVLVGRVIGPDARHLVDGYACNLNGLDFVRDPLATVNPGDRIVILSADAGG